MAHIYFLRNAQKKAMRFANFEALKRIDGKKHLVKNHLVLVLRILAILAFIVSIAGVTVYYDGMRNDFDYILALDTSSSMVNTDIAPTRLEAAKQGAITFLNSLDTTAKVGLITFSGVTQVIEPLSLNHLNTHISVSLINISRLSGTDISGAIVTATNLLMESNQGKSIILFTDGVDTVNSFMDDAIEQSVIYALENDVVIHTVGFGTQGAPVGYLPELYGLKTDMDRQTLIYISNQTGGKSFFPETTQDLFISFDELTGNAHEASIPIELHNYGVLIGLLFLLIEWVFINLRFRKVT
jgi:Ca-activated chloride channel family protein